MGAANEWQIFLPVDRASSGKDCIRFTDKESIMRDLLKVIAAFCVVVALFLGLGWVIMGNDFFMYKVFAPKTEQVRREVVEESLAYRRGTILTLSDYRVKYESADDAHKPAIADLILQTAENFNLDKDDVSPELRAFIRQLRSDRSGNSTR